MGKISGSSVRGKISSAIVICWMIQLLFAIIAMPASADTGDQKAKSPPNPATGDFQSAFDFMKGLGCAQGFSDGQAHLDDTLTRSQAVTILVNCSGMGPTAKILANAPVFPDSGSHWASGAIAVAKNLGWVSGFPDGKFHPDDKITNGQLIQMLDNAIGIQTNASLGWPTSALQAAVDAGLIAAGSDMLANADGYAPRGAAFFYANQAFLNVPLASGKTLYEQNLGYKKPVPPVVTKPEDPPAAKEPPGPPVYNSFPQPVLEHVTASVAADTYAQIKVSLTSADALYYVVLPGGSPEPDNLQVKAGKNKAGEPVEAGKKGSLPTASFSEDLTVSLTGLTTNTAYTFYVVGYNNFGYVSPVSKLDFTTAAPPPPAPSVTGSVYSNISFSSPLYTVDFTATFANATKLYYIVPNDDVPADAAAVKAGIAANGQFAAGNVNVSGLQPQTFTVTMTVPSIPNIYTIYIVAEGPGGLSAIDQLDFTLP